MRRSLTTRLTSLALLLVFIGVGTTEAYAVRECPHHDPAGSLAADDHRAPHDVVRVPEEGDRRPAHDSTQPPCSCVGTCHASADAPLGSTAPVRVHLADRIAVQAPPAPSISPLPDAPAYLLPYPNGPPLSA